jgi:hypothetical protein
MSLQRHAFGSAAFLRSGRQSGRGFPGRAPFAGNAHHITCRFADRIRPFIYGECPVRAQAPQRGDSLVYDPDIQHTLLNGGRSVEQLPAGVVDLTRERLLNGTNRRKLRPEPGAEFFVCGCRRLLGHCFPWPQLKLSRQALQARFAVSHCNESYR